MALFIDWWISLAALLVAVYWWFKLNKNDKYFKNIPLPPTVPFFGNALDFSSTRAVLPTIMRYRKDHGPIFICKFGPLKTSLLVLDYKFLEFIMSSPKLITKSEDYKFLDKWLGTGLLVGTGLKWRTHRKILTPAFHFQILEDFIDIFSSCGDTLVRKLSQKEGEASVNIYPLVQLCTLDVICESTMGIKINAQDNRSSEYVLSVNEMCRIIIERSVSPVQMYDFGFYFTKNRTIQDRAVKILHDQSNEVIDKRHKVLGSETEKDNGVRKKKVFLDILLEATVDGRPLTKVEIREEVDTFMFAGHDTTATAISFTLFCLANYPEVQKLVHEEQQALFGGNSQPNVTYADLQSMKYLEQVIKESLRLYPPVPIIGRQSEEDLEYENTIVPKGAAILLCIYGIHRDPKYFPNPEVFDPNRFAATDGKFPYCYIPFSAGPRNCIGQKFAMLELKSIISKIIRNFELLPSNPEHKLELAAETVLKSVNGLNIGLKLRGQN